MSTIEKILEEETPPSIADAMGVPKENTLHGQRYDQPVTLGAQPPAVRESDFLPENVIPLEQEARDERKLRKLAQNPTKVLVKGGKRVVKLKINVPIDEYAGLQRFEGATDGEKINAIIRMANRRVDAWQREQAQKRRKEALAPREVVPGSHEAHLAEQMSVMEETKQ